MKIEAVVICVNYSDFLAHTLPANKNLFDRLTVVSAPYDKKTQKLCEYHHVNCLVTNDMHHENAPFNKGRAINVGLNDLKYHDWVVHLDADIYLPPMTRTIMQGLELDRNVIYGIDRMMCPNYREWLRFIEQPILQQENDVFVHLHAFPVGTRIAKKDYGGFVPLGFFQMWHASTGRLSYPTEHVDAGQSDLSFALQWSRRDRHFLPELIAIHLGSEPEVPGKMGDNWVGRKTKPFSVDVLCDPDPVVASATGKSY